MLSKALSNVIIIIHYKKELWDEKGDYQVRKSLMSIRIYVKLSLIGELNN